MSDKRQKASVIIQFIPAFLVEHCVQGQMQLQANGMLIQVCKTLHHSFTTGVR